MKILHRKTGSSKTISWSSGSSMEILIYPSTANFRDRDFLFRISLATVEADQTVFTSLPKVMRTLMVVKGHLTLKHEKHHTIAMKPFDQDTFSGDWDTQSAGLATNFNLMCQIGSVGVVNYLPRLAGAEITSHMSADIELIYLQSGKAKYEGRPFEAGDCLMVESGQNHQVKLYCEEDCNFIQSSITLTNSKNQ